MKIVAVTGEAGSGKGVLIKYLVSTKNARHYRFSKILADLLDRLYVEHTRSNMTNLAMKLRELFGEDGLARVLLHDIQRDKPVLAVIDGVRFEKEMQLLRKIPDVTFVAVTAPSDIRFSRITKRNEKADDQGMTLEKFNRISSLPTEIWIPDIMAGADVTIDNSGTLEDFYNEIDKKLSL